MLGYLIILLWKFHSVAGIQIREKLTERKLREEITHNDFIFNDIIYFSQLFSMREIACVWGMMVVVAAVGGRECSREKNVEK